LYTIISHQTLHSYFRLSLCPYQIFCLLLLRCKIPFDEVPPSIIRVLVLDITNKHPAPLIPTLEVPSRQRQNILLRLACQALEILFCDVAYAFIGSPDHQSSANIPNHPLRTSRSARSSQVLTPHCKTAAPSPSADYQPASARSTAAPQRTYYPSQPRHPHNDTVYA